MKLKGIGPTTASALVASIGNGFDFKNGRQMAAWLGLTPSHCSAGVMVIRELHPQPFFRD